MSVSSGIVWHITHGMCFCEIISTLLPKDYFFFAKLKNLIINNPSGSS